MSMSSCSSQLVNGASYGGERRCAASALHGLSRPQCWATCAGARCTERQRAARMSCTAAMPGEGGTAAATPMVTLRVELPDGDSTMTCESGDILRDVLLAEKVVADPEGLLGVRNETESKKLRKKPASYRLACQTNTGDGETGGEGVIVRNKPK